MACNSATFLGGVQWRQSKAVTGYDDTQQSGKALSSVSPGSAANRIYVATIALGASASSTINVQSLTDAVGDTITATKVYGIHIENTGANITLAPGGSDPLTWFFGGTSPTITIHTGGFFVWASSTLTAASASVKNLTITNLSGSTATSVKIELLLGQ